MTVQAMISTIGAMIALVSAIVAILAVRQQRVIAKYTAGYSYIANAESMLESCPRLFALHGISREELEARGIEPVELIYLIHSFTGAALYYSLEGKSMPALSEYRKRMFAIPKVRTAWNEFIRGRFVTDGPFTRAVDKELSKFETAANPAPEVISMPDAKGTPKPGF